MYAQSIGHHPDACRHWAGKFSWNTDKHCEVILIQIMKFLTSAGPCVPGNALKGALNMCSSFTGRHKLLTAKKRARTYQWCVAMVLWDFVDLWNFVEKTLTENNLLHKLARFHYTGFYKATITITLCHSSCSHFGLESINMNKRFNGNHKFH